jgi:hypothetical protein
MNELFLRHLSTPASPDKSGHPGNGVSRARMLVYVCILALPFLLVVVAFRGLADPVDTFHGQDEDGGHYPLTLRDWTENSRM